MRMKLLVYRADLETFLGSGLPRTLHLASLDLCSPIQRGLRLFSATSLRTALALLQAKIDCHVYCVYPGHPKAGEYHESAEHPNEDDVWSVYLVNATDHANSTITKTRVGRQRSCRQHAAHPYVLAGQSIHGLLGGQAATQHHCQQL